MVSQCVGQPSRLMCASRTSDQVTGYSRWCRVPEGIWASSMTYNLKMTCLWDDKALLFMKYSPEKYVSSALPSAQMCDYFFVSLFFVADIEAFNCFV